METEQKKIVNRLRRIEGQVRGLQRLIEEDAPCTKVLTQLSAAQAAMKKTGNAIIQARIKKCLTEVWENPAAMAEETLAEFRHSLAHYINGK